MIRNYHNGVTGGNNLDNLTTASSSTQSKYSTFNSDALQNSQDQINQLISNSASIAGQDLMDSIIPSFAASLANLSFKLPAAGDKVEDAETVSGIPMLIKLILGIIKIPVKFGYMFAALTQGTQALALSLDGLGKSTILGITDIFKLVMAILNLVFKYFLCILSFTITTIGGCFLIHTITFMIYVVMLIFPLGVYVIHYYSGYDATPIVDKGFEMLDKADDQQASVTGINFTKWPAPINLVCYTCFGKKVQLREVLTDFAAIKDITDLIQYDFTKTMPIYLKNGVPMGKGAMNSLDKVFN